MQKTVISAVTPLIVKVAMRGEVDKREKPKIVFFCVSGSNTDDPPKEISLEPSYPS